MLNLKFLKDNSMSGKHLEICLEYERVTGVDDTDTEDNEEQPVERGKEIDEFTKDKNREKENARMKLPGMFTLERNENQQRIKHFP